MRGERKEVGPPQYEEIHQQISSNDLIYISTDKSGVVKVDLKKMSGKARSIL